MEDRTAATMARPRILRLNAGDNVAVALQPIPAGYALPELDITARQEIPQGHKIALCAIPEGSPILKFDVVIGYAGTDLQAGDWLHSHNIRFDAVEKDYAFARDYRPTRILPPDRRAVFQGIRRANGRVGTRNYIGLFVTVNCSATVARKIANHFDEERLQDWPHVDGVIPFIHESGCGMEMTGEPMDLLRRTLAGYVRHPNMAGAVVVSLGCERNDLMQFFRDHSLAEGKMLRSITMQHVGGTARAIAEGKKAVRQMLDRANEVRREPCSAEHITIGMQCGGSDGLSGLTANPALGAAADILIRNGGTAILSETPEIFGVEQLLTRRARSEEVGRKLVDRMDWWLDHTRGRDTQINGNVSPGNNAGGLANVLEKSLGGAKKGGTTGLMQVYRYAKPVDEKGLVFMDTPGFDPVSATGQIAGGANLICFTTGRGSCFGSYPSPTIKLASNSAMFARMEEDMDVNCGRIADGTSTIEEMGEEIFRTILDIASGRQSKSEALGVGEDEFAPWPIGVTG
ncbi:UxaA family hydrolase [Paracoccus zeaxanthinifaciens]|uniref:UxaA family hydrolase n=1 Tax=Paracoccus zeaxanthinifaciens TaxID=187400 RepID=UPI0003B60559|nr:altronate dehydratase family protein [Paracoccus zeaxanthinifaciens]